MRKLLLFAALSTVGCAYNPPAAMNQSVSHKATINAPVDVVWNKALTALQADGFIIMAAAKDSGIISASKSLKLDSSQADCGNIWGLPFVGDPRSTNKVTYSIRLSENGGKTDATVTAQIQGEFIAYAGAGSQILQCASSGQLEKGLVTKISY